MGVTSVVPYDAGYLHAFLKHVASRCAIQFLFALSTCLLAQLSTTDRGKPRSGSVSTFGKFSKV